jgi:RNA polymerase sigma factor (sigma-70 family)
VAKTRSRYGVALRHVQALFNVGTVGGLTDGQLLERFTTCTGEAAELAFAALVERHGPMVLRVCQSVLQEPHDAQDAFQATFLVLVRKAGSIRKRDSVASWLYGVACRIAACARAATARRRMHERRAAEGAVTAVDPAGDRDDRAAVLHQELDRLPEKYRAPIVLCYLESLTHEQAAQRLRWPVGTVRSRLARGREQLRGRLTRRGLVFSVGLLEGALAAETATAAVPAELASATAEAAVQCAAGRFVTTGVTSLSVALLVEGAINAMFVTKMKFAVLACILIATGAAVVAQQVGRKPEVEARPNRAEVSEYQASRTVTLTLGGEADDDAAVARDLDRLELDVLAEQVQHLREQVKEALRVKLRAEWRNSGEDGQGPGTPSREVKEAQSVYASARAAYLARARELRSGQRRLEAAQEPRPGGRERSRDSTPPNDDRLGDQASVRSRSHPPTAAIGSINMDAVFQRYEKAQQFQERFQADVKAEREPLAKLETEAGELIVQLQKFAPGSPDFAHRADRVAALRSQLEIGRERVERESSRRQARTTAALLEEIQETIASVAKARGLNYVVKVSPGPRTDAEPGELTAALNRSVVYADPRNDLTEEVIRELNRRFKAGAY